LQCLTPALQSLPIVPGAPDIMPAMLRIAFLAVLALAATAASAAEFVVSPIRLDFEPGRRSATVTVSNDDERPLRLQLKLMQWTQDASGQDVYTESDELVYFPKLVSVQPKDRRLIRIGVKAPAGTLERTYRLFLDELPDNAPATASGLRFSIRFALPIFLPAVQPHASAAIESMALEDGKLRVAVANTGNEHLRITSVAAHSGAGFGAELGGWYLLPGVVRIHTIEIPAEACRSLRRLDVTVKTDKLSLERGLDVEPRMCGR
jgi:fimbrial chaperone protein